MPEEPVNPKEAQVWGGDPASIVTAVVQCDGFRCMAYRDARNVWRDFHSGRELTSVKEIVFTIPFLNPR